MRISNIPEPSPLHVSNADDMAQRRADDSRAWPRCEPALTHFELGASSEYRPTSMMAKRYTPRRGIRKE